MHGVQDFLQPLVSSEPRELGARLVLERAHDFERVVERTGAFAHVGDGEAFEGRCGGALLEDVW